MNKLAPRFPNAILKRSQKRLKELMLTEKFVLDRTGQKHKIHTAKPCYLGIRPDDAGHDGVGNSQTY